MGRRMGPLDPADGPVERLACELRALRALKGDLPFWKMARRCAVSKSALAAAAAGRQLPSEKVTHEFVRACDGDWPWWRERWCQAAAEVAGENEVEEPRGGVLAVRQRMAVSVLRRHVVVAAAREAADPVPVAPAWRTTGTTPAGARLLWSAIGASATVLVGTFGHLLLPSSHRPSTAHAATPPAKAGRAGTSPAVAPVPGIDTDGEGVVQPIRRVGTATITPGSTNDLDLDSPGPGWKQAAPEPRTNDLELTLRNHRLTAVDPATIVTLPPGSRGTRHECGTQQAYGEYGTIATGALLCVITTENRYALLRVTDVRYAGGVPTQINLAIKVWEPRNAS